MTQIKFGTDGWRAVIAEDFTFANVAQAAANPGSQQSDATTRRKQRDAAVNSITDRRATIQLGLIQITSVAASTNFCHDFFDAVALVLMLRLKNLHRAN